MPLVEHGNDIEYNGTKLELNTRYFDDCVLAASFSKENLNHFITTVNSFHPALNFIWEISETSVAFPGYQSFNQRQPPTLTSVYHKPTDSHSYLLNSSSHSSHVEKSIPFSQFLRLQRLCSDDSDFSNKSEEISHLLKKLGYIPTLLSTRLNTPGNFLVRNMLKSDDQPGTFKCANNRCNPCPFICNIDKIKGPKRSIKIIDRFLCTSAMLSIA